MPVEAQSSSSAKKNALFFPLHLVYPFHSFWKGFIPKHLPNSFASKNHQSTDQKRTALLTSPRPAEQKKRRRNTEDPDTKRFVLGDWGRRVRWCWLNSSSAPVRPGVSSETIHPNELKFHVDTQCLVLRLNSYTRLSCIKCTTCSCTYSNINSKGLLPLLSIVVSLVPSQPISQAHSRSLRHQPLFPEAIVPARYFLSEPSVSKASPKKDLIYILFFSHKSCYTRKNGCKGW